MSASETTLRDIPAAAQSLPSVAYDKLVVPMICEWGPMNEARETFDFDDFATVFGPGKTFLASYYTAALLQIWFRARKPAIVIRCCHLTAGVPATAAKSYHMAQTGATAPTKGSVTGTVAEPFALVHNDTLICDTDGIGPQTATVLGTAGLEECGLAEPYGLVDGQTLIFEINGVSKTATFNTAEFAAIGAATAVEVCAVINAECTECSATATTGATKVTITSDQLGTGSSFQQTGGTAAAAFNFNGALHSGTGSAADLNAVTIAELKIICDAAWTNGLGSVVTSAAGYMKVETNTTGSAGSVAISAASSAEGKVGLDTATHSGFDGTAVNTLKSWGKYYGAMGNYLTYDITTASSGEAARFDYYLYLYGKQMHVLRDATMDTADPNYIHTLVNDKQELLTVADQSAAGTPTQRRPANVTGAALASGDDGLTALTDADFYGTEGYATGLYALDALEGQGDIAVCPDRATTTMQVAAKLFVHDYKRGKLHFIADPPASSNKAAIIVHRGSMASTDFFSGLPWPRVKIANPSKEIYGDADYITVPPSIPIATRMALNSEKYEESVVHQPGNRLHGALPGVIGLEGTDKHEVLKSSTRRAVSGYQINPIVEGKHNGIYTVWINDVQVLNAGTDSLWTSVGASRHVALVRKTVEQYMEERRTQNNSEDLRQDDQDAIERFLESWADRGAFATKAYASAFYVNTDPGAKGINNPVEQRKQKYHVVIGLAYAEPARFIDVGFTRDERAVVSYIMGSKALG